MDEAGQLAMIIYEVNLQIAAQIADEFSQWLANHIDEMLEIDGFEGAEWWQVESEDEAHVYYSVHYQLIDRQKLTEYFAQHADRMRGDGLARFGESFSASRRVLLPVTMRD